MVRLAAAAFATLALSAPAFAAPPPADALPLSEILRTLEATGDVAWFEGVDWDDDGYWEVEYRSASGAKVEVEIDPVSGKARR